MTEEPDNCVRRVPIFARLTPEQQDTVGSWARVATAERGQVVQRCGEPLGRLIVVHSGRLKIEQVSARGRRRLLRVAGPGDVIGEHEFLTGQAPDYAIEALDATRMCVFQHADLADSVRRFPRIAFELMRSLSDRLTDAERRLGLGSADVPTRLAAYLLELPAEPTPGGLMVRLPWPKKDVAAYLGTTPESLSRAFDRLAGRGLIELNGSVVHLLDPGQLEVAGTG